MKRLFLIMSVFAPVMAFAQSVNIHLNNGTITTFKASEVEKVEFCGPTEQTEHEAVDLGLSVNWATCNIGAETPEEEGGYFAWGEVEPRDYFTADNYKYKDDLDFTWQKDVNDAAYVAWGGDWRMPTRDELQELIDKCTWTKIDETGRFGYLITSNVEGYTDKSIFIPCAGFITEYPMYVFQATYMWTSTRENGYPCGMQAYSDSFYIDTWLSYAGYSVRGVCDK